MFNTMIPRDIRQTLDHFRRTVDQLFSDVYSTGSTNPIAGEQDNREFVFAPAVESNWTDNELLLRAIVPGVNEQDVKVTVQNDRLILEGQRKLPEGWTGNGYTQMSYGKFHTAIPLPSGLNLDKVSCRLHDGVLDIQIPVAEQMKPRQIPIGAGDHSKAISA